MPIFSMIRDTHKGQYLVELLSILFLPFLHLRGMQFTYKEDTDNMEILM